MSEFRSIGVEIKRAAKLLKRDWATHLAYRLSHHIYVIANTFGGYNNVFELIRKSCPPMIFLIIIGKQ